MSNPTLRPIPAGTHPYKVERTAHGIASSEVVGATHHRGDRRAVARAHVRAARQNTEHATYGVSVMLNGEWVPVWFDGMVEA